MGRLRPAGAAGTRRRPPRKRGARRGPGGVAPAGLRPTARERASPPVRRDPPSSPPRSITRMVGRGRIHAGPISEDRPTSCTSSTSPPDDDADARPARSPVLSSDPGAPRLREARFMSRERAVHLIRPARSSACLPSPLSDIRSLPLVTLFSLKVCRSIPSFCRPLLPRSNNHC